MDKIRYFTNKPSAVLVPEDISLSEKEITENGSYTAEAGSAWDSVTVDVAPDLESGSATANGTYRPTEGKDGFSDFTVAVPLGEKNITANGTYLASADGKAGYSSVNVTVAGNLPTLYPPSLSYGSVSRPLQCQNGGENGDFPTGYAFMVGDVSWQIPRKWGYTASIVMWVYDKFPVAGGTVDLQAKATAPNFNISAAYSASVSMPAATATAGYSSVSGLGNSDPTTATFTYDTNFPRSFQEVQDIYGNYFIKIPTIYRKVLASSDGQITSYALATSALDSDYKPYPCFIDWSNNNAILPYILIGEWLVSSGSTANSIEATPYQASFANARTLARARGTGYQLFDWQMWELVRDLGLIISRFIDINQGSAIYSAMGFWHFNLPCLIDGVFRGSNDDSEQWYCAYDPANYYTHTSATETEASILSHGYAKLSYKSPSATGFITKLGYDPNNPFFNQPSEASGGSGTTYYCDQFALASTGIKGVRWHLGATSRNNGWFHCYIDDMGYSTNFRLCYRPILGATGYTE